MTQETVFSKKLWFAIILVLAFSISSCNRVVPPLGVWYRGESLGIVAFEIERLQEMHFEQGNGIYKIEILNPKTELVAIRLVLINSSATNLKFSIDNSNVRIQAKGLNERMSYPIDPFSRGHKVEALISENGPGFFESLLWGSFQGTGVGIVKSLLWGPFDIDPGQEVEGWIVFDVPKGTMFEELHWNAGDTVVMGK